MFCGNIFTSTDLQNHKKNHMKKSQKRFHRVNRALFLSLSNAFEEQKFIPKISPKKFWSAPCFPKIVCGGQCEGSRKYRTPGTAFPDKSLFIGQSVRKFSYYLSNDYEILDKLSKTYDMLDNCPIIMI